MSDHLMTRAIVKTKKILSFFLFSGDSVVWQWTMIGKSVEGQTLKKNR